MIEIKETITEKELIEYLNKLITNPLFETMPPKAFPMPKLPASVTAGELRWMGFSIDESIPNIATIDTDGMKFKMVSFTDNVAKYQIITDKQFEWVDFSFSIDSKELDM